MFKNGSDSTDANFTIVNTLRKGGFFSQLIDLVRINCVIMCGSRKYPYPHHGGNWKFQTGGGSRPQEIPKRRGVASASVWSSLLQCKLVSKSFLTYSKNVLHRKNSTLGSCYTIVLHFKQVFLYKNGNSREVGGGGVLHEIPSTVGVWIFLELHIV